MEIARREVLKIGGDLAVEFANTVSSPAGSGRRAPLLERPHRLSRAARRPGARRRSHAPGDGRDGCPPLRRGLRPGPAAPRDDPGHARRHGEQAVLCAPHWVAEVNQALASRGRRVPAAPAGWRVAARPVAGPGRSAPGPGPDRPGHRRSGRVGPERRDRQVRQPTLRPLLPRPVPHPPPALVLDGRLRQPDEGGRPRPPPRPPPLRLACFALDSPRAARARYGPTSRPDGSTRAVTRVSRRKRMAHFTCEVVYRGIFQKNLAARITPRHRALGPQGRAVGHRVRPLRRQPAAQRHPGQGLRDRRRHQGRARAEHGALRAQGRRRHDLRGRHPLARASSPGPGTGSSRSTGSPSRTAPC